MFSLGLIWNAKLCWNLSSVSKYSFEYDVFKVHCALLEKYVFFFLVNKKSFPKISS